MTVGFWYLKLQLVYNLEAVFAVEIFSDRRTLEVDWQLIVVGALYSPLHERRCSTLSKVFWVCCNGVKIRMSRSVAKVFGDNLAPVSLAVHNFGNVDLPHGAFGRHCVLSDCPTPDSHLSAKGNGLSTSPSQSRRDPWEE